MAAERHKFNSLPAITESMHALILTMEVGHWPSHILASQARLLPFQPHTADCPLHPPEHTKCKEE